MAFTDSVTAVACIHRRADTVKGGELSYMVLALQREPAAYRSLLMLAGTVLADPEPMLARLVRGCIALAFTASVLAVACIHRRAGARQGRHGRGLPSPRLRIGGPTSPVRNLAFSHKSM